MSDSTVRVDSVDLNLPPFPLNRSKAVLIGKVTDARGYLSNDKTGIYSAFSILIDEIIANSSATGLKDGDSIEVEREGGRVRFPSGRVHIYMTSELNMPAVGGRYVLFLTNGRDDAGFQIVTGYELREGVVYPLDQLPNLRAYENMKEEEFLTSLRKKIAAEDHH